MLWVYNLALIVLAPIWVPWMIWRTAKRREKPDWNQRAGWYSIPENGDKPRLWFHAVSVGEVVAASAILTKLRALTDAEIILSVTTSSGHQTARERYSSLFDHLVYFPLDLPLFQLRAIGKVRPDAVAIMETELWMNFLWAAKRFKCKTLLLNGRISDKSFESSKKIAPYYRALFGFLDEALCQTETDKKRMNLLGAKNAQVLGNCKFDEATQEAEPPERAREWLRIPATGPVVIIGSTRSELEEDWVCEALAAVRQRHPDLCIVWAPRHIERAQSVVDQLTSRGFAPILRSQKLLSSTLVMDTFGELSRAYGAADIAIVGGGFDKLGGQNLLQPMGMGIPVIHGPHMQNFRDVAAMAGQARATLVAASASELQEALLRLLQNSEERARMGLAGKQLIEENKGASERYAQKIFEALSTPAEQSVL